MRQKFNPGRLVATPGALAACSHRRLMVCLGRHLSGDWGEACPPEDREENEHAFGLGLRLLSAYFINPERGRDDGVLWLITEADRSSTTMLLPDEY